MNNLTLHEAYEITRNMTIQDDKNPTELQSCAKQIIYNEVIKPKYLSDNVPPYLEPDYNEGWK